MGTSVWEDNGTGGGSGIPVPTPEGVGLLDLESLGAGTPVLKSIDSLLGTAYFRTLTAGDNIALAVSPDGNEIEISSTVVDTYTFEGGSSAFHFTAIDAQTEFSVTTTITLTSTHVWRNGLKLVPTTDFTVDTDLNTITLISPCMAGEQIEILISGSFTLDLGVLGSFQQDVDDTAAATATAIAAASTATTQAGLATSAATASGLSATAAEGFATTASDAATAADSFAITASNAATAAEAALDAFSDIYLGAFAVAPTLDNDGGALTTGDLYFDTVSSSLHVWSGAAWIDVSTPAAVWGSITGTLSNQTDLDTALSSKLGVNGGTATSTFLVTKASDGTTSSFQFKNTGTSTSTASWISAIADTQSLTLKAIKGDTPTLSSSETGLVFTTSSNSSGGLTYVAGASQRLTVSGTGAISFDGSDYGTTGDYLQSAGSGAPPTWSALGTMATESAADYTKKSADAGQDMNNNTISEIKTATFNSQATLSTTTGAVTIDWTAAQNYKQNEPTGGITYTFTAPPGPCHLQLLIDSDGTSTAQTITWPTLTWIGATWVGANNKKAIINFWYDGTNYFAQGGNQV